MSERTHERSSEEREDDLILAHQEGTEALTPWVGWVLAPAAWALHQGIGYAMVTWLCRTDRVWPYHALTVFCLGLCSLGALASVHALHRSRHVRPERSRERMRMMALIGLMFCAAALGGIGVEYVGSFAIEVCAGV